MRYTLVTIISIVIFCSCTNNAPQIVNELYSPDPDSLFIQCKQLSGIGDLIIGKTTFSQAQKNELLKDIDSFNKDNNLYSGYWGEADKGGAYDKACWLEKNAKDIKQISTPIIPKVKIGDIELDCFDLAFLNGTLVAIYFETDSPKIRNHYIEKYGNGRGNYHSFHRNNQSKNNLNALEDIDENRIWENETVCLEYNHKKHSEIISNKTYNYYSESWYLITDKCRYNDFTEKLAIWEKEYDTMIANQNAQKLDLL